MDTIIYACTLQMNMCLITFTMQIDACTFTCGHLKLFSKCYFQRLFCFTEYLYIQ